MELHKPYKLLIYNYSIHEDFLLLLKINMCKATAQAVCRHFTIGGWPATE